MLAIIRSVALFIGLVGAICASQLPEFAQQYRQRLGGAVDELNRLLANFDQDAASNGMTREQGIARLRGDTDPFIRQRGERIAETSARAARLEQQLRDFATAGSFQRLVVLTSQYDGDIGARAYATYEPGVPVTGEGLASGAAGLGLGYFLARFLAWPVTRRLHRRPGMKSQRA